eukprot:928989-Ditylum_brightwellii.AAC.1
MSQSMGGMDVQQQQRANDNGNNSVASTSTGYNDWSPSEKRRFLQLLQSGKSPVESSNLIKAAHLPASNSEVKGTPTKEILMENKGPNTSPPPAGGGMVLTQEPNLPSAVIEISGENINDQKQAPLSKDLSLNLHDAAISTPSPNPKKQQKSSPEPTTHKLNGS